MASQPDRTDASRLDRPEAAWTAIVLAGERPGGDPLASALQVPLKALIEIHGRPLIDLVLAPLLEVERIGRVVILAQDTLTLKEAGPACLRENDRISLIRSDGGIASSVERVAGSADAPWPVLVTTADNALLTRERVETFLDAAPGTDISIGVGDRSIVEREFPETRRTWLKFCDGHFSGANLFALTSPDCRAALRKWSEIEKDRKRGLKLIASFGPVLLLRTLTRTITFSAGLERAARKLGCTARAVVLDAEAPIDVDKLADLALVERILAGRA